MTIEQRHGEKDINVEMPQSQRKLREAKFFLGKLRAIAKPKAFNLHHPSHLRLNIIVNAGKNVKLTINNEDFQFYLSGFLSAARSVTFVLQKESKKHYDHFLPVWLEMLPSKDRRIFKTLNDQRVAELHKLGVDKVVSQKKMIVNGRSMPRSIISLPVWHFSGEPQELLLLCTRYLELLERLIQSFLKST